MLKLMLITILGLSSLSCVSVVRDEITYSLEIDFLEQVAMQQAEALTGFIQRTCRCEGEGQTLKFVDPSCESAAKKVAVVNARVAWHKSMMLYNAGLLENRPVVIAPPIPETNTYCPGR